jgi:hypothetical protein
LVIGFSIPVTTMLRKGEVYEAAIFASQFFFMGGCYWAYSSFKDEAPAAWKPALAGIHWAFALGSRATILPAVAVTFLIMVMPIFRDKNSTHRIRLLLTAGIPLLAGGIALAWYNYARFGDILEFGVSYQLANLDYTQFKDRLFGAQYILVNLKTYFLHPVAFAPRYPFLSLVEYTPTNDRLAGLLYVAPFIALAFLPLFRLVFRKKETDVRLLSLFAGGMAVQAFIIFGFFFITLRYTLDFMPSALILIVLALGMEYESLKGSRFAAGVVSSIFGGLALVNVTAGILLATPQSGVAFMVNFLNALSKLLGLR